MEIEGDGKLLLTRIFEALLHPRRRAVLYYLNKHGQAEIEDIAIAVAAWEQDIPTTDVSSDERKRVQLDLYHNHIPKLAENNIIEYDQRSGAVSYSHPPSALIGVLDFARAIEGTPDEVEQ